MYAVVECKRRMKAISSLTGTYLFVLVIISIFLSFHETNGHYLVKRDTETRESEEPEDSISPEECEEKIKEREKRDEKNENVECFEIDHDKECDDHCSDLGEEKCGGSRGKAFNFQCKNPQIGDKKACCCSITCESKRETKRRLEDLYADMKRDNRGLCSSFTDSSEGWNKKLKKMCSEDDRIHIARKYCLEEKKGEKYFCLKVGECRGEREKTCLGCIAHECVMEGEDEGDHIVVPKEYEIERLEKQDFDKSAVGNVEDHENVVKKEKHCTKVKCNSDDDCNTQCRKYCKDHGNKDCDGSALSYGVAVEGKQGGGKHGENKCCCQPVCSGKDENKSISDEIGDIATKEENTGTIERESTKEEPYREDRKSYEQQDDEQPSEGSNEQDNVSNKSKSEKYKTISEEEEIHSPESEMETNEKYRLRSEEESKESKRNQMRESGERRKHQKKESEENDNSDDKKDEEEDKSKEQGEDFADKSNDGSNQDYTDPRELDSAYDVDEDGEFKYESDEEDYDY